MNIGIIGYGRMGKMVERVALQRENTVSEIVDMGKIPNGSSDVYIEFTLPDQVLSNVRTVGKLQKPIIIGTTGWEKDKGEIESYAHEYGVSIIYGGNFSLGVNLFWRALKNVSTEFAAFSDEYDVFTHEFHHRMKKDSPSGTALTTAHIVEDAFPGKTTLCDETLHSRAITPSELHVTSTRGGSIPGTHSVYFDSEFDTVEYTHRARTREGFALGAVLAAENIQKLPVGLNHFPEVFDVLFGKS